MPPKRGRGRGARGGRGTRRGRGGRGRGRGAMTSPRGASPDSSAPACQQADEFRQLEQQPQQQQPEEDEELAAALRLSVEHQDAERQRRERLDEENLRLAIQASLETSRCGPSCSINLDQTVNVSQDTTRGGESDESLDYSLRSSGDEVTSSMDEMQEEVEMLMDTPRRGRRRSRNSRRLQPHQQTQNMQTANDILNNDQVIHRMRAMFETSLQLHATGQYMQACTAIKTQLYPHQMYALAWMANRENSVKNKDIVHGGILADDMGLGKTLTILSLILTNFHDGKPLARPVTGFVRYLSKNARKFLPQPCLKAMDDDDDLAAVGTKANRNNSIGLPGMKRKKDLKLPVKSAKRRLLATGKPASPPPQKELSLDQKLDAMDDSSFSVLDEKDEFDNIVAMQSLGARIGIGKDDSDLFKRSDTSSHHNDGLSSDEEYQLMTEEERNELMKPKYDLDSRLNVDGALRSTTSSDEDEEYGEPSGSSSPIAGEKSKKSCRIISDDDDEDDGDDLPELDSSHPNGSSTLEANTPVQMNALEANVCAALTDEQRKNLIIPPKEPASCRKRNRSTLIVTPSSLISHWLEQIQTHVDPRVDLKVFVHHGPSKSMIARELEDQDIVITTYGTMMAEYGADYSPLLKAKWLRVCLDEGHYIKNHRAKTSKAAKELKAQRKWIISGTPIQNNLGELWSLLYWLDFEPYSMSRNDYKVEIEIPVKHGDPRGVYRLQTVVEAICLRRTKSDEVNGKPLVALPKKTVRVVEIDFPKEERTIYDAYEAKGQEIIMKYLRRGTLLNNYAHVFAVMMRLRQLCCHREMLPVSWADVDMRELEALAAKDMNGGPTPGPESNADLTKRLAEQLREMIKAGMSDECSICLVDFDHPVITLCAHIFCRPCITQYIESSERPCSGTLPQCPLCRGPLDINQLLEAAPEEREEAEDVEFEDIVVSQSSAKVMAALKELAKVKKRNKNEKTIIVSQFTSLLSIIQPLLTEEGYDWTRLDGSMSARERSAVIANFQDLSDDTPSVLLLSLRAGGVGLNLTAASNMILLDPAWNPSTEDQCFDRIHRLGQNRDVTITKFVMAKSIEQRMLEIQNKKKDLISGAFRQTGDQRRQQRIQDIRHIFGITGQ